MDGLLPYQQRWVADNSPVRVWEKSRRIGASWTCALESVLFASKKRSDGGCDTWYSSYNKETTAEYIRDCKFWCGIVRASFEYIEGVETDPNTKEETLAFTIRFISGHKISALSSNPHNLRNRKGRIIIDEAAFRPLKPTMKAAMAILMWGGSVDVLSTHDGVDSEFNAMVEDIRSGKLDYSLHRTTIKNAVDEGLYKRICAVTKRVWSEESQQAWLTQLVKDYGPDANEELFCIPARSGGTYLPRLLLEDRMILAPVLRFNAPQGFAERPDTQRQSFMQQWLNTYVLPVLARLPKELNHSFGEDFGRSADLTVIAPITTMQTLKRRIPFLVELRDTPFREQELALQFITDRLPNFCYGALDATGNGQYLAERAWQKYGKARIEQTHLSEAWYWEHLPRLKVAIEDGLLEFPRDADVLGDLLMFQTIKGIPRLPDIRRQQKASAGGAKKVMRHGDAAIAIALAYYASSQHRIDYDGYKTAAKRSGISSNMGRASGRRQGGLL